MRIIFIWSWLVIPLCVTQVTILSSRSVYDSNLHFRRDLDDAVLERRARGVKRPASGSPEVSSPARRPSTRQQTSAGLGVAVSSAQRSGSGQNLATGQGKGQGQGRGQARGQGAPSRSSPPATGQGQGRGQARGQGAPSRSPSPARSGSDLESSARQSLSPSPDIPGRSQTAMISTFLEGRGKHGVTGGSFMQPGSRNVNTRQRAWFDDYGGARIQTKKDAHMGVSASGKKVKTTIHAGPNAYSNGYLKGTGAEGKQYKKIEPGAAGSQRSVTMTATAVRDANGNVVQPGHIKAEMFHSGKIKSQTIWDSDKESMSSGGTASSGSEDSM